MKILVTGGAGFIGSAVIRHIIKNTQDSVVNLDKLTYAGNLESLTEVSDTHATPLNKSIFVIAQSSTASFSSTSLMQ